MVHIIKRPGNGFTLTEESNLATSGMAVKCKLLVERGDCRAVNEVKTTFQAQTLLTGLQTLTSNHSAEGSVVKITAYFAQGHQNCSVILSGKDLKTYTINGQTMHEANLPDETKSLGTVLRGLSQLNEKVFNAGMARYNHMPFNTPDRGSFSENSLAPQQPTLTR